MDFGLIAGDTDATIYVRLRDSTTGLAKTGLAFNSAGAVCSYVLPRAARAAITLATQTVDGAHSDGGFVEVDATNCKGLYRLDLPDAAIASGAYTLISIEFDGIIEETIAIPLHTKKVNITQIGGDAQSATDLKDFADAGYDPGSNKVAGVVLVDTLTTYTGNTPQTGDAYSVVNSGTHGNAALKTLIDDVPTTAEFQARTLVAADYGTAANQTTIIGYIDTEIAAIVSLLNSVLEDTGTTIPAQISALNNLSAAQVNAEVDTALADINLDHFVGTATGIPAVPAGTYLDQIMDDGTASFDRTTDSLQAIRDNQSGGSGGGAYTLTVTVNDGAAVLEGARVRLTEGATILVQTTNASGVCTFSVDAATWAVAITKAGYTFTPTTKVVSGTGAQTYSMTAVAISASDPDLVTGYATCYDENGEVESGVSISCVVASVTSTADEGLILDRTVRTETSDGTGLVEFTNLVPGVKYTFSRGDYSITATAEASNFTIGSFAGN